jgi:hypothetical protein
MSLCDFDTFGEFEGFVIAVDVVCSHGSTPQDEYGDDDYGDQEGSVETSKEIIFCEDVFSEGRGRFRTEWKIAAVDGLRLRLGGFSV